MKIFYFILAVSLLSCSASKKNMSTKFAPNQVVAHRGAFKKNSLPENSIASLKEAIRLKCTGSEFDVRMSSDDSLVINHDAKHHDMQIEKTTYADLIKMKLSNGEKLPTLRELLTAGLENNQTTRLVVEIKPSDLGKDRARALAQKVVQLIKEMKAESMVAYISFDYDILKKVQELNPRAVTQYLNGDYTPEQLKEGGITGLDYNISVFRKNPDWIARAQKANLILNAWTVNSEADMKWLLENKFQFITTNEPELLLALTSR